MAAGAKEERTMRRRLRQSPLARRKGLGLGSEAITVRQGEAMADGYLVGSGGGGVRAGRQRR